ncbi:MAG TPA: hypothetical protein VGO55_09970 [Allosphingosinicella sp.]|jgi:hypothetical protein|nr:hypothetical protein [Allosphingosinicella sp.]
MTFSYNAVWDDTGRLLRAHGALLAAIAGVFVFLPTLLVGYFFPLPEPATTDLNVYFQIVGRFMKEHLIWYVLQSFVVMVGTAAMLRLVFPPRVTVAGAILFGALLLPAYSVLTVLTNIIVFVGLLLLLVPGLYLWGRVLPAGPAMVAEDKRSPLDALKRGFALSRGQGWAILGLLLLVLIPGEILIWVIQRLVGILFILAAGQQVGNLLTAVVYCALTAIFAVVMTMLSAAIYRALAAPAKAGPDLNKAG